MRRRQDRPLIQRLSDGFRGLCVAWRRDQAVRTHLSLSAAGIVALAVFRPPVAWTLAVLVLTVAGLAAELVNSALEVTLDKLHPEMDPAIGAAKEMASAAAAVINLSAIALFIGALLAAAI